MDSPHDRIHDMITLDLPVEKAESSKLGDSLHPQQTVVLPDANADKADSDFSLENRRVLTARLQRCAGVLSVTGLLFALWDWCFNEIELAIDAFMSLSLVATSIGLASIAWFLRRDTLYSSRKLRVLEFLIFAPTVIYCGVLAIQLLPKEVQEDGIGFIFKIGSIWMTIIYTYGLYVPNDWRRACVVLSTIALIPLSIVATMLTVSLAFSLVEVIPSLAFLAILLTIAVVSSCIAGSRVQSLRKQIVSASRFGQYTLGREIGRGGMGSVYLAKHELMKRPAAIKLIRPTDAGDKLWAERFEREVHATAQLSHWNVVEIYDYGRTRDGAYYYVMEYLPGKNLNQIVKSDGIMSEARAVHFIYQVCDALREAHSQGLVHRDIKPANIIAASRGGYSDVAKLVDFGLVQEEINNRVGSRARDKFLGSPQFMSPEQAMRTRKIDARSDIYSLAATLFFLLTGRPPHGTQDVREQLLRVQTQSPPNIREINPNVSFEVAFLIAKALERDPGDRFSSADEFSKAIESTPCYGEWASECAGVKASVESPLI